MKHTVDYFVKNDCYAKGDPLTPKGIVIHSTAAPGIKAEAWKARWNKSYKAGETSRQACTHAFVDDEGSVQALPWNMRGWHAGSGKKGTLNDTHIGIEMCEPAGAVYNKNCTAFAKYDVAALAPYFAKVWDNTVELAASLCVQFSLDPTADGVILCHQEGARRQIASNHADVFHWFPKHGKSMDDFRQAVKSKMAEMTNPTEKKYYRVQVGAFTKKASADALLTKLKADGYNGYIKHN